MGGGADTGTGPDGAFHGHVVLSSDTGDAYSELQGGALVVVVSLGRPFEWALARGLKKPLLSLSTSGGDPGSMNGT